MRATRQYVPIYDMLKNGVFPDRDVANVLYRSGGLNAASADPIHMLQV